MCNDCRTQDVTAIADALAIIGVIGVSSPASRPARAGAIENIRRAARHLETYSAALEKSNGRLREELLETKARVGSAQLRAEQWCSEIARLRAEVAERVDMESQLTRARKRIDNLENEVVRLRTSGRIINELVPVLGPSDESLVATSVDSNGRFSVTGHAQLDIVVDLAGSVEFVNRSTGRKASGSHHYGNLDAQAFSALEAVLPDVTLTPANTPRRLHAKLFVMANSATDKPKQDPIPVNQHVGQRDLGDDFYDSLDDIQADLADL